MTVSRILVASRIAFMAGLSLFLASAAVATTRYLDKSAVGANNGSSPANAWTSVSSMNYNLFQNGDTLQINGGNYSSEELPMYFPGKNNITFVINPAASQPAVFKAIQLYEARNCTLDGYLSGTQYIKTVGISSSNHGILIRESNDSTVRGIEVDGSAINLGNSNGQEQHGIALNGNVSRITIENCYIHHILVDGINTIVAPASPADTYTNVVIRNNRIFYVGDDGLQMGSGNLTLNGNDVDQGGAPSYPGSHPDGIQLNPNQRNVIIAGNTFRGFIQNIFIEFGAASIYIYNNLLIGSGAPGITERGLNISATEPFGGAFVIANNTFYNFTSFLAINGGVTPTATRVFANNVFINCKLGAPSSDQYIVDNTSVWYDTPGVVFYDSGTGTPSGAPSARNFGSATNINPSLMNVLGLDFRPLNGSSPVVVHGTNLSSYFTTDRNGASRAGAGNWDVGAFVLGSPSTPGAVVPPPPPAPVAVIPNNARTAINVQ